MMILTLKWLFHSHSHRKEQDKKNSANISRIYKEKWQLSVSNRLILNIYSFIDYFIDLKGISCAYVGDILLHGHLYVTDNYLAFHSNVFGYVTRVRKEISPTFLKLGLIIFRSKLLWHQSLKLLRRRQPKLFQMQSQFPQIQRNTFLPHLYPETKHTIWW